MPSEKCDFLIIGGGVIGVTVAMKLMERHPRAKVLLLEKESGAGRHASGRNSGVLHAGFYYTSDSLKARFTRDGNRAWHAFCEEFSVPVNRCGKLVVAKDAAEDRVIDTLLERGQANGISLEILDRQQAREIEPKVKTYRRALFSPSTSTVDPGQVMGRLVKQAKEKGVKFKFRCAYRGREADGIATSEGKMSAGYVVNCAGLYADNVAADFDFGRAYYLLPFKGVYLYAARSAPKMATNIYPVPDLNYPFLGVHFTVTASGTMKLGPSAIPAVWPEQYDWHSNFRLKEFAGTVGRHLRLMMGSDHTFRRLAAEEIKKYTRSYMVKQAKLLAAGIGIRHFDHWGSPGIRAQLINKKTKKLEMDFIVQGDNRSMHVLNAVSPAFTCAFPFAEFVVSKIEESTQPD